MLKLYNFHASSTSYRTRIVLNLKGLAYEYIPIRLDRAEHLGAAYSEINPMHGVPTLEVDGVRLYQSGAIIEYLEEVYPDPPLLPNDAVGRAQVRAIADIVGSDMHPVNNLRIRNFIRDTYKQDADGVSAWIHLWNKAGFEAIETMLRADKKRSGFCYGVSPTVADAYVVSHAFSAARFKTDMSPYPEIRAVIETCTALKPFADAHPSKQPDAQG
ncbi:MAG TPA: maleylacetoacetate isomerase [Micropepsaceae bacterium]|jgi:maleylpyruvate isomerase|nr:maleylacetoacetate isomerase [Micropepsaceae bacterium]